jgi:multicomponent Na+:H+ antiporter subunit E
MIASAGAGRAVPDSGRPAGRGVHLGWFLQMVPYFAVFWLLLSGHFEPLLLALGVVSVALVCVLSWRAGLTRRPSATVPFMLRLPRYFLWLVKEVLVSSLAVVRRVWSPRPILLPAVTTTASSGLSELSQVVYANSITLTPGTLSLEVGEDHIEVHALTRADVKQLHAGAMLRRVRRLEARR